MSAFAIEEYAAGLGRRELDDVASRADTAAAALTAEQILVRYVEPVFVPEDEVCLHVFEGPTREAVAEAARRAQISAERVLLATITTSKRR